MANQLLIRINPLDSFFFRDAKPFNLGEESWADSVFPPAPSVIYGALRSLYFIENKLLHLSKNELDDKLKDFKIKGIFIQLGENQYLLPIMNDVVEGKKDKDIFFLEEKKNDLISCSAAKTVLVSPKRATKLNGFTDTDSYSKLLSKLPLEREKILDDLILKEPKIGLARNNQTHASEEGKLYRVEMQRFDTQKYETIQFAVLCENLPLEKENYTSKIGGEGKIFSCSVEKEIPKEIGVKLNESILEKLSKLQLNDDKPTKSFRLCLVTPAFFENGSLPKWLNEKTEDGTLQGKPNKNLKLKLRTTFVGKSISIGGFDLKARQPKTMNKYVPAGAVYYFDILEGTPQDVIETFHFKSISENQTDVEGFGIAYVGSTITSYQ